MGRHKRTAIDYIKTVVWMNFILQTTGMNTNTLEWCFNAENRKKRQMAGLDSHKCYRWKDGIRCPSKANISKMEKIVPGARQLLNHPLWEILNNIKEFRSIEDIEGLLLRLNYPKAVLFKSTYSNFNTKVRIARPIDWETANELRYSDMPEQGYFKNDLENLDLMAAYFILAHEAKILGSIDGQIIALKTYEESKPLIRKIPELKGVENKLFEWIENSGDWNYPALEEEFAHDKFMRDLALGLEVETEPPYQWLPGQEALLGTMSDEVLAERLCLPKSMVWYRRYQLDIYPYFSRDNFLDD